MALTITVDAQSLSRSQFATSPAMEMLGVFRHRLRHPSPHARAWYILATEALPARHLALLEALVPDDHGHAPDFITPAPRPGESMDDIAARIAATPAEEVEYHLDIGMRGRRMVPHVLELHANATAYEQWRRPMPPALAPLVGRGGSAVAAAAAEAIADFFDTVLQPQWARVRTVLAADIAHRADRMAAGGAGALLNALGEQMRWTGSEIVLDRPYAGAIDWADDGILFVPSTTHVGQVLIAAEFPHRPVLTYGARGVGALWERPPDSGPTALADLIGPTRATLLTKLGSPQSTLQLSRDTALSAGTVSYHLGILERSRLLDRSRRGRNVVYRRTALGDTLVGSHAEQRASG